MEGKEKTKLYYDGECPMCTAFIQVVSKDTVSTEPLDLHHTTFPLPATKDALLKRIHLVDGETVRVGADAILTSLARIYPILRPLQFLIRLPLFKQLADLCYLYVGKRRRLFFAGEESRIFILYLLVNLGLLLGLLISYPAWLSERVYPFAPIFEFSSLLLPFSTAIFLLLIISLVSNLFALRRLWLHSLISLSLLTLLILPDYTRLQPWIFHYLSIFFLLTFLYKTSGEMTAKVLNATRILLAGIYLWSGIQKFNTYFFTNTFPWFTEHYWFGEQGYYLAVIIAFFVPLLEAFIGLGLLTKRFRKPALALSVLMFMVVIGSLTVGHNWNPVVWPWNFILLAMAFTLFLNQEDTFRDMIQKAKKNLLAILTTLIFILLPAGNWFGFTDHYLSWSLYSGHVPRAEIRLTKDLAKDLNLETSDTNLYDFAKLTTANLNLVPYPEVRVFEKIYQELCVRYNQEVGEMNIIERAWFFSHRAKESLYTCDKAL